MDARSALRASRPVIMGQVLGIVYRVSACIEDLVDIKQILDHPKEKDEAQDAVRLPDARAPPQATLFDWGEANKQGCCLKGSEGWRSAAGGDWRSQASKMAELPELTQAGQGGFPVNRAFILPMLGSIRNSQTTCIIS